MDSLKFEGSLQKGSGLIGVGVLGFWVLGFRIQGLVYYNTGWGFRILEVYLPIYSLKEFNFYCFSRVPRRERDPQAFYLTGILGDSSTEIMENHTENVVFEVT